MYILKQTNILKYGLITISLILSLFCFYVVVGFLGIQELTKPYPYGTFFTWVIIFFGIFYRFTFLLLTIGVFFGIVNVLEWHWIIALLFTLPSFVFIFPKQILNFKIKSKSKSKILLQINIVKIQIAFQKKQNLHIVTTLKMMISLKVITK